MVRVGTSFLFLLMLALSRSEDAEESHSVRRSSSESSERNTSANPALRELLEGLISSTMSSSSPENRDLGPEIPALSQSHDVDLSPDFAEAGLDWADVSLDESIYELLNLLGNESRNKRRVNTNTARNPLRTKNPQIFNQFGRPAQLISSKNINLLSRDAQTQKLEDNSESMFSLEDGRAMMKMIKGMPREFKLRFIALLLRSDRRGLQNFLREVIAFHMRSGRDDDDALQSNAVSGKLSHDLETLRGTEKSLQSPRIANGRQNKADVRRMSSARFASRQGSPVGMLISHPENSMLPNIQSAVILHRETISEPGKILKAVGRQRGKSIQQLPSFHPNSQLKEIRSKPVAVPEPAKLHHFIRQSSVRQPSNANRFRSAGDPALQINSNVRKPNETTSISSSELSQMLERIRNTPAFSSIVSNIMQLLKSDEGRTKLSTMPVFSNSGKSLLGPSSSQNVATANRLAKQVSGNTRTVIQNTVGVPLPRPGNLDTRVNLNVARQEVSNANNNQPPKNVNSGAQLGNEFSTIENQLRGAIKEQNFVLGSAEDINSFQQNSFFSSQPDFSQEIIGFSRTAFNPSPVLTVQPQTIVPLSTDIEGQLFDEAIENFKEETEGSSITTGNFVDENSDFDSGVLNFVPLSTDIQGQLTNVPKITADKPQQITGQVLTSSGVPLPIGPSVNSAKAAGPGGLALALADFAQSGQPLSTTDNQVSNNPGSSSSFGVPLPAVNSPPKQRLRNPVTIADILRTQSGDSFDMTLHTATNDGPPRQTQGTSFLQTPGIDSNGKPSTRDESLPGKSLSLPGPGQGNFNFNSLPATDIFGNPIRIPLPGLQDQSATSIFPSEQADVRQNDGEIGIPLPTTAQNSNAGGQNSLNSLPQTDIFGNIINIPLDKLHSPGFKNQQSPTDSFDSQGAGSVGVPLPTLGTDNTANDNPMPQTDIFGNIINIPLSDLQNVRFLSSSEEILPGNVGVAIPPFSKNFTSPSAPFNLNNQAGAPKNTVGVPLPSFHNQAGAPENTVGVPLPSFNNQAGAPENTVGVLLPSFNNQAGAPENTVGVPLPSFNNQAGAPENTVGVPLPSFNNQAGAPENTVGVPLPSFSNQAGAPENTVGVPLPSFHNQAGAPENTVGVPLPSFPNEAGTPENTVGVPLPSFHNQGSTTKNTVGVPLPSFENDAVPQNIPKSQILGDVGVPLPETSDDLNTFGGPSDQKSHDQFSFLSTLMDSKESIEADDVFFGAGLSTQAAPNMGGYDVIDEKGYPSNSQKHKLVTFFSSGLLLPFTEREVMYKKKKKESSHYARQPAQPPKYSHHFRVYKDGEYNDNLHLGSNNNNVNHRAPSLTYTAPPLPDSTYAARSLACESRTVVTTSVLLVDLPPTVTTITELTTAVQMVKSYYVTPVTVAQTYTVNSLNTVAQYQADRDKDKDTRELTTVHRLPAISLLSPSSLFNTVDTETGAKKTYNLPTKKASDGPEVIHLQAVKYVRRRRSADFSFDTPRAHKLTAIEVPGNGSQRIPFIIDHTVRIGQPVAGAEQASQQQNFIAGAARQRQALPGRQDSAAAARQQYSPPLQQNYVAPIRTDYGLPVQSQYVPPVQNEYTLPLQNEYTPPVQNEYTPPVQNEYTPPVQNEYTPPVQNEYTPPVQNEYTPPVQNEYTPPVQNGYTPPVQNEYTPPVQNEYAPPVQNEYSPSVQNPQVTPIQNQYVTPVQNQYIPPLQNYAPPVQNEYIPPARSLYAPSSTVIVTTVLRTTTSMVPRTLVGTNYRVSTVDLGQTATTIRSTSVYCLQPEQRRGQYNQYTPPIQLHSATPPLPISPHSTKYDHVPTAFVRPTPKLKPDAPSYQTWVGAVVGKDNGYSNQHSSDLPSKFILLQNLKPRGFVVEDGSKNGGTRVKLSHDEGKYGGILNRKLTLDSVVDSDIQAAISNAKRSYQDS